MRRSTASALVAGSAAILDADFLAEATGWGSGERGWFSKFFGFSRSWEVEDVREAELIPAPRTPSENLARIRANLSLNVSELARILGVERPTIYSWMGDDEVVLRPDNRRRLAQLERVALHWREGSELPVGALIRQANPRGESVVSLLEARQYESAMRMLSSLRAKAKEKPRRRLPTVQDSLKAQKRSTNIGLDRGEIDRVSR